jgi:hypothetical protein
MFDTYKFPSVIRVNSEQHEHRAPTDKSVELLREMEQKAREQIISVIRAENNDIKFDWVTRYDGPVGEVESVLIMVINGKRIERKFCEHDFRRRSPKEAMKLVMERVSEVIALEVLQGLFDDDRNFRSMFNR